LFTWIASSWAGYPVPDLSGISGSNFVVPYGTNLAGNDWIDLLSLSNLPMGRVGTGGSDKNN
jgi:hypothetical protein